MINYLLTALVACVGVLVLILGQRGKALHKAQLELISFQLRTVNESDAAAVASARERFMAAMSDYQRARNEK